MTVKRPWNHISQGFKHRNLCAEDKRLYIELTKAVGQVTDGKRTPPKDPSKMPTQKTYEAGNTSTEVFSTGRQRFGDTRMIKYFKLDEPVLVEYQL